MPGAGCRVPGAENTYLVNIFKLYNVKYLSILSLLLFSLLLSAQPEHKVAVGNKIIEFSEIDNLMVVGYDGDELKLSKENANQHVDERAQGLRKISASGKTDNTGLGLSSQGLDDRVLIEQVGKGEGKIVAYVPNKSVVKVTQSTYQGGDFNVSNFGGELDVTMHYHNVNLNNAYGPLSINTIYGSILASFSDGPPTEDIRLHSTYQNVDVRLPNNTQADLKLKTSYGSMYTDFDIEVKANGDQAERSSDHDSHGDGRMTGLINGGGKLVSLTATYRNIYLRKFK